VPAGTIVFVHGTGVRLAGFERSYTAALDLATKCSFTPAFVPCAWGDPLGVEFSGRSLPDPPSAAQLTRDAEEFAQWDWLFDDPLFELTTLTIRDNSAAKAAIAVTRPDELPQWQRVWERIAAYQATEELKDLLERSGLWSLWPEAWQVIVLDTTVARDAFEASAHEIPVAARALARALVAALHGLAADRDLAGPSSNLRNQLVGRLLQDWKQTVLGLSSFFFNLVKRAGTRIARARRNQFNEIAAFPIGDVLLYQSRGAEIRNFIRHKIESATPPVTLIAHSLGGIACVDLLALPNAPTVASLVTAGSQSPFFYEIGALTSLVPPQPLPQSFPPWLNIFDRNDFLSFVAAPLFTRAKDIEISSGQPFPDSHSAYFANEAVWTAIRDFVEVNGP
jgi:hypothetical protein